MGTLAMMKRFFLLLLWTSGVAFAQQVIPEERIMEQVEAALLEASPHEEIQISYTRIIPPFEIGGDEDDTLALTDLTLKGYRFMVKVHPQNHPEQLATISGKIMPLVPIPVLNRVISPGDTIGQEDVDWKNEEIRLVNKSTITDENDLVGTSPRHKPLLAQTAIKKTEVHKPHIVKKGSKITMAYENGAIQILGSGEALENGSQGDSIRVLNPTSRKVVQGTVTGPQKVNVGF